MVQQAPTPEEARELAKQLETANERLIKLWDAYEKQEKELDESKAEIEVLEGEIQKFEIQKESMERLLHEKDSKIRNLEVHTLTLEKRISTLEPELEKLSEKYTREKDRLAKLYEIAEELDDDLKLAVREIRARDEWYLKHMSLFEDLHRAIQTRYSMIEDAVRTEANAADRRKEATMPVAGKAEEILAKIDGLKKASKQDAEAAKQELDEIAAQNKAAAATAPPPPPPPPPPRRTTEL